MVAAVSEDAIDVPALRSAVTSEFEKGRDPQEIYARLKEAVAPYNLGIQHLAAHIFGDVLFLFEGKEGIAVCDSAFAFGCFNSLFGRVVAEAGVGVIPELEEFCHDEYGLEGPACIHGIGHGLAEYFGPTHIKEQLELCKGLSWKGLFFGCSEGVFMEYHVPSIVIVGGETGRVMPPVPDNLYDPCPSVPGLYEEQCYLVLGGWWWGELGKTEVEMDALCRAIPDEKNRQYCVLGIGKGLAPIFGYDVARLKESCDKLADSADRSVCRAGAALAFVDDPRLDATRGELCEDLVEKKELCIEKSDIATLLIERL